MEFLAELKKSRFGYRFLVPVPVVLHTAYSLEIRSSEKPFRIIVPSLQTKAQRAGKDVVFAVPLLFVTGGVLHRSVVYKVRVLAVTLR